MNRREFLAAAGLSSAVELATPTARGSAASHPPMFETVNLQADGLALEPREYITLLAELASSHPPQADYYSNAGAIEELEREFAQLLGKPAALFLPTGTLANHLAVRKLAGADRRVLVQAESHLYNDSGDCAQTLSGLNLVPLAPGRSTFELSEVQSWLSRSASGRVETAVGVICIESPVRRKDHEMFDPSEMQRVCAFARERRIRLHLDGARMFTLPHHSGRSVRDYAALFDTVYVSLWKHFNGASGAILAGEASFIQGLSQTRRMFGGSLSQAWPQVALVARSAGRFQDDYARAWKLAEEFITLCRSDGRFSVRLLPGGTSRFFISIAGVEPAALVERLSYKGVVLSQPAGDTGMFPIQVNPTLLRTSADSLFQAFKDSI
jgi:threonine aldolase